MTTTLCDDEAMRSLVGFLVLGRLSADEHAAVSGHLHVCASCRHERDQVDGVVALLGRLSVADVHALAAEFGAPEPAAPPIAVTDQLFGAPGAPARKPPAPVKAAPRKPPALVTAAPRTPKRVVDGNLPPRPATGPLAVGPHTHRKGRRSRRTRNFALAALTLIALAGVLVLKPWTPAQSERPVVAVAETRDDSGLSLSATLYEQDGKLSARITAVGLAPGAYQLCAGTGHDQEVPLGWLTGAADGGTFTGDVPVAFDDLKYFGLRDIGGGLLVSAIVTKEKLRGS